MKESRQVIRRGLVSLHFERYEGHLVPKDLPSRKDRRKLSRARAAGSWRKIVDDKL